MDQPLHNYMRPGIVQRLAFPGSNADPAAFVRSVETIADDAFFMAVEIGAVPDAGLRAQTIEILRASRLSVVYEAHPRLREAALDINSLDSARRAAAVEAGKRSIDEAAQIGAERLNVASGPDPGAAAREDGAAALVDSLCELAAYAASVGGPTLSLVPFPRDAGESLIGPTAEAVTVVRLVREVYPDVGLTLDTSHMVLMHEGASTALAAAAPYLGQMHLANVVPAAGNRAPPFGVVGGSLDVPQLVETLLALFRVGFLGAGRRPLVCFRVAPQAGERPEWVIAGAKRTLVEAWARL